MIAGASIARWHCQTGKPQVILTVLFSLSTRTQTSRRRLMSWHRLVSAMAFALVIPVTCAGQDAALSLSSGASSSEIRQPDELLPESPAAYAEATDRSWAEPLSSEWHPPQAGE